MHPLVWFLVANGAALYAAIRCARYLNCDGEPERTIVYAGLNWILMIHTILLGCGLAGVLNPGWVTGAAVCVAGVVWISTRHERPSDAIFDQKVAPFQWFEYFLFGCLVVASITWLRLALWHPVAPLTFDDQSYHALYPALWIRDGQITMDRVFGVKAYYPFSGELVAFWFAIPWRSSSFGGLAWVDLIAFVYLILFSGSCSLLFRKCGVPRTIWILPVLFVLTSKSVFSVSHSVADIDLGIAVLLFTASSILISSIDESEPRQRQGVFFSAVASGLACGYRSTALIPWAILFAACVWRSARRGGPKASSRTAIIWIACGIITGGYWYFRNLFLTGNPIFPIAILGLPGVTKFPSSRITEYAAAYGWPRTLHDAAESYLDIPPFYGLIAYAGLVAVCAAAAFSFVRKSKADTFRYWSWTVLSFVAATLIAFPSQPFSAGHFVYFDRGMFPHQGRYQFWLALIGWTGATLILSASRLPRALKEITVGLAAFVCLCFVFSLVKLAVAATIAVVVVTIVGYSQRRFPERFFSN